MSKISNVPQIRFKGFTDAWEQRKLAELFVNSGSGGTPKSTNKDFYDGDIPFLSIADIKGREISETAKMITQKGLESSAAWLVPKGALSLAMYASVGKIGILNKSMATSQAFFNMVFDNEACRDFVYTRLEKAELFNEWESYISTGTQRNLNAEKVKRFKLCVPESHETARIANIFSQIDNYITLHQRKYDQVVNFKKAMLEKMFPKNGCEIPEIRFKDFSGESLNTWSVVTLGEIADTYSGGTPKVGVSNYYGGEFPFIRSGEIGGLDTELTLTLEGLNNSSAKLVKKGDILYALYGATSGEVEISKINGAINQAILAILPNEEFDSYTIVQWLKKEKENITSTFLQGGQGNLSGAIVKSLELLLPNKKEQMLLGRYFRVLDKLICLHQCKLQKLKNIKKALLEKMFV